VTLTVRSTACLAFRREPHIDLEIAAAIEKTVHVLRGCTLGPSSKPARGFPKTSTPLNSVFYSVYIARRAYMHSRHDESYRLIFQWIPTSETDPIDPAYAEIIGACHAENLLPNPDVLSNSSSA
jgi:hypothetical protein